MKTGGCSAFSATSLHDQPRNPEVGLVEGSTDHKGVGANGHACATTIVN